MNKYSKILHKLRSSPKLWESETEVQVQRLIEKCKARLAPEWEKRVQAHQDQADQKFCQLWA
tara:strand:- start:39 stop:224 length:186 start_codon:yes stop_codon:yes gene_type:complete